MPPKRKITKKDVSSESDIQTGSDSGHDISDSATLSDQPPPPVTPRKSKKTIQASTRSNKSSTFKAKKKTSSVASFSPSPEGKSPKKQRQLAKPPSTPTLKSSSANKSKPGTPFVLIQTKKRISKIIKEETESENNSDGEDEQVNEEETAEEEEEEENSEDEYDEDEENEDEKDDEEEDDESNQDNDFLDQEAEEEDGSEEYEPTSNQSNKEKQKNKTINLKRQKVVDTAIKKATKSKAIRKKNSNKTDELLEDTKVYLEDLTKDPVEKRLKLKTCQIYDKDLVDTFLAKSYKGLPKLPSGYTNNRYLPSGEAQEPMMYISELLPTLTKISKKYLLDLFTYVSDKGTSTINLSRIEPCDLIAKKPESGSIYPLVTLRNQKTPALCLTLISVDEDYTRHPKDINGSPYKILTGVIQTMEYERLIATLCLVYKVPGIKTLMSNNRWSFSSRPGSSNNRPHNSYNRSGSSYSTGTKKLSPANAHQAQFKDSRWKLGYTCDENIPILDGRSIQIELPNGLRKVAETLPAFQGDIPTGSLTLVGYTTLGYNAKKSPDELTIGTNICWAVVLATPKA